MAIENNKLKVYEFQASEVLFGLCSEDFIIFLKFLFVKLNHKNFITFMWLKKQMLFCPVAIEKNKISDLLNFEVIVVIALTCKEKLPINKKTKNIQLDSFNELYFNKYSIICLVVYTLKYLICLISSSKFETVVEIL